MISCFLWMAVDRPARSALVHSGPEIARSSNPNVSVSLSQRTLWFPLHLTEASALPTAQPSGASSTASVPWATMTTTSEIFIATVLSLAILSGCKSKVQTRNRLNEKQFPATILWAWERPEDLEFLDSRRFGVAFLAQTLTLKNQDVMFFPRHQPLKVPPEMKLIAVTRIESQKTTDQRPSLSPAQREQLVKLILQTLELDRVSAIQVDFDALSSERDFYRALLQDLRAKLPDDVPLSMTALASFCAGDRWLADLPVDEAVPMIFRLGADDRTIKDMLAAGDDFREPLCQRSYGVAIDEPLEMKRDASRRVYVFNNHSWNESSIGALNDGWLK